MHSNPFTEWQDEDIKEMKKNRIRKRSRRVDWYVTAAIFIYALFTGAVILPQVPLDDGTFDVASDLFFSAVLLVNLLIPVIFVYWRSYTKWYMPFSYFLSASFGNCLALVLVHLFSSGPSLYGAALFTNVMFLILLWYPALAIIKLAKVVIMFIYRHNLI
ncbi:hypothetical protein JNUCC1_02691 [Lentibacillus sp. JNUCC-1]|uniref:hypothetical protein n=1 Tax=Lentibacillus sp. JNUCC-1 TaxID=2654513 RepID=UPI001325FCC8|nr:hypothetical protein [Lentibacillus sp. JNUCC-1]MUV38820.1 hypothetical protein [Lentibacillus sp. JNUCC-1]